MTNTSLYNITRSHSPRWSRSIFLYAISSSFSLSPFTGKERDEETGYGYFGARYMDHELMTGWLSVDPMADKYPSISPYAYCAWNPVKLVDPDGMEIYYTEGADKYVYKKDQDGNYGFFDVMTGKSYSGENKEYVNNLVGALGTLKEGKYGNNLVQFFEGSSSNDVFVSKEGGSNHNNGCNVFWNDAECSMIPVGKKLSDAVLAEGNTPFVSLAHEMKHVKDYYRFEPRDGDVSFLQVQYYRSSNEFKDRCKSLRKIIEER